MTRCTGKSIAQLEKKATEKIPGFASLLKQFEHDDDIARGIRETLRHMRELHGYSLEQFGNLIGLSPSGVSKMETGTGDIGIQTICRAARALNSNVEVIFSLAKPVADNPDVGWAAFLKVEESSTRASAHFGEIDTQKLASFHAVRTAQMKALGVEAEVLRGLSDEYRDRLHHFQDTVAQIVSATDTVKGAIDNDMIIEFTDDILDDAAEG